MCNKGFGRLLAAASAALLALSLTACGADPSAETAGGPPPAGGTLRIAIGQDEPSLGILDFKTHSFGVLDQIYEPLVRYGEGGEITPGLAERWEVSDDGHTMTFHLRSGVEFSDGTAFDAEVAKADLERWVGKEDYSFLGLSAHATAVAAPDASTVVITLDEAYPPALQELTYVRPTRFPSPKAFDASGAIVDPIGTGPYKVDSVSATEIVLVRNDSYWGGRPNLDKIEFKVIPDTAARLAALQNDEVDIIGGDYLAPLAAADAVTLKSASGISELTAPSQSNLVTLFNTETGNVALQDPAVRQAIAIALDRDGYAKALFAGYASPATELMPAGIPDAPQDPRTLTRDTEQAKQLLDGAGWSGTNVRSKAGTELRLDLVMQPELLPQAKALSEAVQADLADIGIGLDIRSLDATSYSDALSNRAYDLQFFLTYGPPYDPFGTLNDTFRTTTGSSPYNTPELDALIDAAQAQDDPAARRAAYGAVFDALDAAWAYAPIVETRRIWAVRDEVKGFELGTTEYDLPLTAVGVAD